MKKGSLLLFFFIIVAMIMQAQDSLPQLIADVIKQEIIEKQFNGVALVSREGNIIYKKTYGYADFKNHKKINENTPFNLASVSKQFTAMCIMQLAEQGKISFDAKITTYYPHFPYKKITVRHLLQHTSGIPDYIKFFYDNYTIDAFVTNDTVMKWLCNEKPALLFEPGEKYEYCNTGYALLVLLVEKCSEQTFEDYLQTKIFTPLGMKNSFGFRSSEIIPEPPAAKSYKRDGNVLEVEKIDFLDGVIGDGNIFSSLYDLNIYANALLNYKMVSKQTWQMATKPAILNNKKQSMYGFGWELYNDNSFVDHTGSWLGYRTYIAIDFSSNYVVIVMDNCSNEAFMDELDKVFEQEYY